MFIVCLVIFPTLFGRVASASIDLVRYHANVYRCGERIIDEDLIRPLHTFFVSMESTENGNTDELASVIHALRRIEIVCRSAYSTSHKEIEKPSVLYHGYKWLKSTFTS